MTLLDKVKKDDEYKGNLVESMSKVASDLSEVVTKDEINKLIKEVELLRKEVDVSTSSALKAAKSAENTATASGNIILITLFLDGFILVALFVLLVHFWGVPSDVDKIISNQGVIYKVLNDTAYVVNEVYNALP